jgi:hypothetical protein
MAVSQLFKPRQALNSAVVVSGGLADCVHIQKFLFQKLALLFIRTASHDARQCTARRHSTLPAVKLQTLKFNVLQLLLGSLLTKFKERFTQ